MPRVCGVLVRARVIDTEQVSTKNDRLKRGQCGSLFNYKNIRPRPYYYPERPRKVETTNHTATQAKPTILVGRTRGTRKSSGASIPKRGVEDRGEVKMRNINLGVTEGIGSDLQPRSMS